MNSKHSALEYMPFLLYNKGNTLLNHDKIDSYCY